MKLEPSDFPKIGKPALRALQAAGFVPLEQLTGITELELSKLHGMGPKALSLLCEALLEKFEFQIRVRCHHVRKIRA
jgi:hypothetical protein